jgi:thioredoxin 1
MAVVNVTEQDFEQQVLRSDQPVLVDLAADWCQPCKQLEPILRQLSEELAGKIKFVRVDVDRSPRLARAFQAQSIPMLVLIKDGRPVDQIVGMADKRTIMALLQPVIPVAADEVAPEDFAALLQAGRAVPVDIRDGSSYARNRIPGAISLPAAELLGRVAELQAKDGKVRILYGRGSDEAKELTAKAREAGAQVGFLSGGFLHWEAAGLGVERGS